MTTNKDIEMILDNTSKFKNDIHNKKFLITGGAGFLGGIKSKLIKYFS